MTAWTEYLAREGASFDEDGVSFAATPTAAATLVVPLTHMSVLQSTGPDSAPYLHNLFSNDVNKLAPDAVQWSSFNSPKGRMLASFLLWRETEGHGLALSADIAAAMHKKLSMYILRSKVKLADASSTQALIGLTGADAARCVEAAGLSLPASDMHQASANAARVLRLGAHGLIIVVPVDEAEKTFASLVSAGAVKAGTAAWQLAMIRAGLPLVTAATQEEFVAQMLNYEVIGGVNFHKGCYPGQEIVARTQYLGKLKKRMYHVALPAGSTPVAGADLYSAGFGEQSAGKLVNVAPAGDGSYEALAVMQSSCAEAGEVRFGTPDGPQLRFLELPYALP